MASIQLNEAPQPGFNFENHKRNAFLASKGFAAPKTTKTGTTICGCVFNGGVVLGADTRATGGDIVSDKNCQKIHRMAPNMLCCGAGTAADCDKTTDMIAANLKLERLNTNRQVRVVTATRMLKQHLFRYQGYIGAYLVLGGVDVKGPHIVTIHAHGSTDNVPYTAMGSGSLAAMAMLETQWRPGMTEDQAKSLIRDAIAAGIINDMGSGSNVDLAVIRPNDDIEYLRTFEQLGEKSGGTRPEASIKLAKGATTATTLEKRPILVEETTIMPVSVDVEMA